MLFLWQEYKREADLSWQKMDKLDWEQKKLVFHNWRSGSKIFGMNEFARKSQIIEENILKKRLKKASLQILEAKELFDVEFKEVERFFMQMEQ
ncbi:MAG: hypothetical protein E7019_05235 [Alphaproteobacteria bacterium]|nr:hypothetical protein [Alphaproteobacteria bacterium]